VRTVPAAMTAAWSDGDFVGVNKPIARVTIQRLDIQLQKVDADRLFASALFGQADIPRELPNVKSVSWERSVGTDVASCTIVFYNTEPLPLGTTPATGTAGGDFDQPGAYTFNRGATSWSASRWGHTVNEWADYITPDRVLRTYEGYGFDHEAIPEEDAHLVQTGTWIIDEVEYSADGLITVTCRDIGRLLLDHLMFPPVIPLSNYPLEFEPEKQVANPDIVTTTGTKFRPTYASDSGVPYNGSNGTIFGHKPSHAFDGSDSTYWLSIGNALPSAGYSFEHIEGNCGNKTVAAVTYKVWGGPYRVYLSLRVNGVWQGGTEIPYDETNPASAPNGSNINFVAVQTVAREGTATFKLKHPVSKVERVRLTFTRLFNSGLGSFRYRAGVRDIECSSQKTVTTDGGTHTEGDYANYTDIVKYLLASTGFHWPKSANSFLTYSDGSRVTLEPTLNDPRLKKGRVWGDLQSSAPAGPNTLTAEIWDKKPVMDGIAYVRDVVGFIFCIDEQGAAVFRMPNIWTVGNYIGVNDPAAGRVNTLVEIDEKTTLLGLRARLTSRNIREHVIVANVAGKIGAVANGYNPITPDPGLRRVTIWTDQNFENETEARVMAELIAVRQMFTYRSDTIKIAGYPRIQIDDQVKIFERVTNEGYVHYVRSIRSSNDNESGEWTYDLTTNWLGETPGTSSWAFNPSALSAATQEYLEALGAI
jgi:hypothetical protein